MKAELLDYLRLSVKAEIINEANGGSLHPEFSAGFRQGILYATAMAGATTEELSQAVVQGNTEAQETLARLEATNEYRQRTALHLQGLYDRQGSPHLGLLRAVE